MRLTEYVHLCLEQRLQNGDQVLDATAGNGYDTLKAAQLVSPNGRVVSVDIQADAIRATEQKLTQAKLTDLCEFHLGNHAELLKRLNGSFDCILFNLGYLPGGNKAIISTPKNTLSALSQSHRLLKENGLLFVMAYRQHKGGQLEADQVEQWMLEKETQGDSIEKIEPNNQSDFLSPILWVASKSTFSIPHFANKVIY